MDGPVVAEATVVAKPISMDAPVTTEAQAQDGNAVSTDIAKKSIFGEVAPTEAELRGEIESESEGTESATLKPEDSEVNKETTPQEQSKEPTVEAKKEEAQPDKPAEKTVPLAALHEERKARKALADRVKQLEAMLQQNQQPQKLVEDNVTKQEVVITESLEAEVQEFMETYPEFSSLIMEASNEGNRLRARLEKAGVDAAANMAQVIEQRRSTAMEQEQKEAARYNHMVESSYQQMEAVVPGLFDADGSPSKLNSELTDFAVTNLGYSLDQLASMTDPRTIILPPGAKAPVHLGPKAAENVRALWNAYQKFNATDVSKIEAGLRDRIEKEMSAKVLGKLKTAGDATGLHGLSTTAGSQPNTPYDVKDVEVAYRKMSPEQRETFLRTGSIIG